MTKRQGKSGTIDVKALVSEDEEFFQALVRAALQEVLEAEMTEALGAERSERTAGRQGYRSGYYGRTLITRVGKLERRVPQDRAGRFSTELFERYQRSERALVAALAEMYVVADDHAGLRAALREALAEAADQRCYVHFLRNALDYVPCKVDDDCLQELRWLGACPFGEPGGQIAARLGEITAVPRVRLRRPEDIATSTWTICASTKRRRCAVWPDPRPVQPSI